MSKCSITMPIYFVLFCWVGGVGAAEVQNAYEGILHPYSAEIVRYHQRAPNEQHAIHVVVSRDGVRIEVDNMLDEQTKQLFIQNFNKNLSWLVKPKAKTFTLLPVENDEEIAGSDMMAGVMSTQPCDGDQGSMKAKDIIRKDLFNGDPVVVWRCESNVGIFEQYYSVYWAIVVREVWPSGDVAELRQIKSAGDFQESYFYPPKHFREVLLEEFMTGAPKLESYSE
jgi:hypothetical protein